MSGWLSWEVLATGVTFLFGVTYGIYSFNKRDISPAPAIGPRTTHLSPVLDGVDIKQEVIVNPIRIEEQEPAENIKIGEEEIISQDSHINYLDDLPVLEGPAMPSLNGNTVNCDNVYIIDYGSSKMAIGPPILDSFSPVSVEPNIIGYSNDIS